MENFRKADKYPVTQKDIIGDQLAAQNRKSHNCYLHDNEQDFQTILVDNTPVLMGMTNSQGELTCLNQSWLDFLNIKLQDRLIQNWLVNVHPGDQASFIHTYQLALKKQIKFEIECRSLRADRKYRWILYIGIPRFNSQGDFVGFVISGIDINQLKITEELLLQHAKRERLKTKIIQHIHTSLNLDVILQSAVDEINQFLQAERIFIAKLISPTQIQTLFESVNLEFNSSCSLADNNLTNRILRSPESLQKLERGEIVLLENIELTNFNRCSELGTQGGCQRLNPSKQDMFCQNQLSPAESNQDNYFSLLVAPMTVGKKLWGLLFIERCSLIAQWQFHEIELLKQISLQLAIAIDKSELYQQLQQANRELEQLAVIDSLTGIPNRRKFDEYLANEWMRLAREQAYLSLILCDIDFFKLYNDTYGHQAGDRCLYQVAQAIRKTVKRPADLPARYGGEELVVILPNTTPEGAEIVAQQICLQIKALAIPHIVSPIDLYITLSFGVAGCIPAYNSSPQKLIQAADRVLYQAKQSGRNRVIRADTFN